jgi:hypothetical protein
MVWAVGHAVFDSIRARDAQPLRKPGQITATTLLNKGQLDSLLRFRMTPDGPYFLPDSAINPQDGSGVAADGDAPFSGQAFFHPQPGTVGALQRRMFSGPWTFNLDFGVQKLTRLRRRRRRVSHEDNILNHHLSLNDTSTRHLRQDHRHCMGGG